MIEAIIFDFGDVFINLNYELQKKAFISLGLSKWTNELDELNKQYETGKIDEITFMQSIQKYIPTASLVDIRSAWNSVIADFPLERLEFLQLLTTKYQLFLLSNTDATHIEKFEHNEGQSFARDFYSCFEKVYFSFEIGMRKPDIEIFKYVLNNHNLSPKKTLFIDDKLENILAAASLGLKTWHLQVNKEYVTQLYEKKLL